MAIVIEDVEAERLLERVREQTGGSVAEVVRETLRERVARLESEDVRLRVAAIREIQERVAKLPVLDTRPPDEIVGYNECGHFD